MLEKLVFIEIKQIKTRSKIYRCDSDGAAMVAIDIRIS